MPLSLQHWQHLEQVLAPPHDWGKWLNIECCTTELLSLAWLLTCICVVTLINIGWCQNSPSNNPKVILWICCITNHSQLLPPKVIPWLGPYQDCDTTALQPTLPSTTTCHIDITAQCPYVHDNTTNEPHVHHDFWPYTHNTSWTCHTWGLTMTSGPTLMTTSQTSYTCTTTSGPVLTRTSQTCYTCIMNRLQQDNMCDCNAIMTNSTYDILLHIALQQLKLWIWAQR